ncbi:ATP-dependent nuclease [Halorhabdus utahensis]|nr:AAA family ATPase [Halorhabdus utahensis]
MSMRISSFSVRNYKAIKEQTLEFGEYNIIIGKNDVGKSSVLEAIDLLLKFDTPDKSDFHMLDESNTIILCCEFEEISDTLKEMLTDDYLDGDNLSITARYTSSSGRTPDGLYINGEEIESGAIQIDEEELSKSDSREYIKEQLSETVTVLAERDHESETSLTQGSWLTRVMSPVFSSDNLNEQKQKIRSELEDELEEIKASLNEVLSDQHSHINDVQIELGDIDLSKAVSPKIEVRDDNVDEWMPLSERGSGVGNQFILSMMKSYADSELDDGYYVLYEEPENSLHPSAVREMDQALREIASQGNQVIITTHSQSLIDTHENGSLIVASNDDGEAEFKHVKDDGFEAIEAIGAKNSDILQSDYVLYTEGASDAAVIEVICQHEFDDWDGINVTVQPAGGGNLRHQLENMKHINRNSGILIDSDRTSEGGELGDQSALLVDEADRIDLDRWVLERREIENYFHADAIEDVLEVSESINIGHYDEAEDILEDYNYDDGKVQNARDIAQVMYEIGVDDEFSDLKSIVEEAFDGV